MLVRCCQIPLLHCHPARAAPPTAEAAFLLPQSSMYIGLMMCSSCLQRLQHILQLYVHCAAR